MKVDSQIKKLIDLKLKRQQNHVEFIASENYVSEAILAITGSILTNKYAEGYPYFTDIMEDVNMLIKLNN